MITITDTIIIAIIITIAIITIAIITIIITISPKCVHIRPQSVGSKQ
jgi:hypothetical protein